MVIPKQNCSHGEAGLPLLFANQLICFLLKATTEMSNIKTVAATSAVALYLSARHSRKPKLQLGAIP